MSIDFQRHADALYRSLGRAATWLPRTGPAAAVTLLRAMAPELMSVRGLDVVNEGSVWHARVSEVARPQEGDHFRLADGRLMRVQSPPRPFGRRDLQWLLDCHEVESLI